VKISINTPILGKEEIKEVNSVLKAGLLTTSSNSGGKNIQEFEKLASSFIKSKFVVALQCRSPRTPAMSAPHVL